MTTEQYRNEFLHELAERVKYWLELRSEKSREDLAASVVFGVLTLLDGCGMGETMYDLIPSRMDAEDNRVRGEDIAGSLHDGWYDALRKAGVRV